MDCEKNTRINMQAIIDEIENTDVKARFTTMKLE
jgi:hypothetical protein